MLLPHRRTTLSAIFALCWLALPHAQALAQSYPSQAVRIVVGDAAGGVTDLAARIIAPRLAEALGQPVVVSRLNTEVNKLLRMPEVREALNAQGAAVLGGTPDALSAMVKSETASFTRMAREFNIRLD